MNLIWQFGSKYYPVKGIFYPVTAASVSALRQDIYSYTGLGQVCLHVESVEGNTLLQYSIEEVFPPRDYPSNSAGIVHRSAGFFTVPGWLPVYILSSFIATSVFTHLFLSWETWQLNPHHNPLLLGLYHSLVPQEPWSASSVDALMVCVCVRVCLLNMVVVLVGSHFIICVTFLSVS